jgi:AI-2 transport protein TqsA
MIKLRRSRTRRGPPPVPATPDGAAVPAPPSATGLTAARLPRGTIALVALAALTVTAIGMNAIRGILAPVLLTLILVICVHPVRTALRKRGVNEGLASGSIILLIFALLLMFGFTVLVALGQFAGMLPQYSDELKQIALSVGDWLSSLGFSGDAVAVVVDGLNPSSVLPIVVGALGGLFSLTGALVVIFTMVILMASDAVYLPTVLRQLDARRPNLVTALEAYAKDVRRYMVVTTVLGVAQGALNSLALWMLGVPAPLLWGLLAFLCSFIPNIGYFFAIIPPLVFGLLVGGWPTGLAVIIIYGLINAVVQSIVQPRVVGQAVSLSQTITFFSVLFWAVVIGPIGAILAIPLTLLGKALLVDADPDARFWRPALGPTRETRDLKTVDDAERTRRRRGVRGSGAPSASETE